VCALGSSCVFEYIIVAYALLPSILCALRAVIPAFVLYLRRGDPHPLLGFPTGLYPVGCEGRINYSADSGRGVRPLRPMFTIRVSLFQTFVPEVPFIDAMWRVPLGS